MQEGGFENYLIEFVNLGLVLKSGTIIMEGVHGSFKPGRICAIMGPSGAGTGWLDSHSHDGIIFYLYYARNYDFDFTRSLA